MLYSVDLTYTKSDDNPVEFNWRTELEADNAIMALALAKDRLTRHTPVESIVYCECKRKIKVPTPAGHILEAECSRCGERFNPADEDDLEHVARADGTECGGEGVMLGHWELPR